MNFLILRFFFVFISFEAFSQNLPISEEEFKNRFLKMDNAAKIKDENYQFLNYVKSLKVTFSALPNDQIGKRDQLTSLKNCVLSARNYNDFSEYCLEEWKLVSSTDLEYLKSKGILSPEEFKKRNFDKQNLLKKNLKAYDVLDDVIVFKNAVTLSEVTPELSDYFQTIDPQIKSISKDVSEILLKMYSTTTPEEAIKNSKLNFDGKEELIKLSQIISEIGDKNNLCWHDGSLKVINSPSKFFLGIQTDASKIKSYKFSDETGSYLLYRLKDKQIGEQLWVMGKIDKKGSISFNYYDLNKVIPSNISLSDKNDIKIMQGHLQQTSFDFDDKRLFLQMQAGLVAKREFMNLPIIGKANIPQGDIIIGSVEANYLTPKVFIQNNLSFGATHARFEAEASPVNNTKWSIGTGFKYSTVTGNVEINSRAKFYNLYIGYTDNLMDKKMGEISYIFDKNFIQLNSDFRSGQILLGRHLPKKKGVVMGRSNITQFHELKVILYLP